MRTTKTLFGVTETTTITQKKHMNRFFVILLLLITLAVFSSCQLAFRFAASMPSKKTTDKWQSGNYKTRIQLRMDYAGPGYYHCKITRKRLGGLYCQTLVKKSMSYEEYKACIIRYPLRKDTIILDVCSRKTYTKSIKPH